MNTRLALSVLLAGLILVPAVAWVSDARAGDADDSPARIQKLIEQLGDDSFEARTKATEALRLLGRKAEPALRKAAKEADSEEVRWRAEQLLLRLDGAKRKSLDDTRPEPDVKPRPRPRIRTWRDRNDLNELIERLRRGQWRGGQNDQQLEEIFKSLGEHMEDLGKRFEQMEKNGQWSNLRHLGGLFGMRRSVAVPGLELKTLSPGRVQLHVKSDSSAPAVYEGSSLDDILSKHPSLRDHAQMKALQDKSKGGALGGFADFNKVFEILRGGGQHRVGVELGEDGKLVTRHVETEKTDTGYRVKITEKNADGKETVTEVEGESLEAIKRDNPELAKKLGGMQIHFSVPQVFWGDRKGLGGRLERFPRRLTTPRTAPTPRKVFGVVLNPVSESLAAQLGLGKDEGVMVEEVTPGSAAEKLGVLRYDILLSVDDKPITMQAARTLLSAKADASTPMTLEIIRRAKRETLSR